MRRRRIEILKSSCRRCGVELYTASRSITGADALKARLGSICEECTTDEERDEILNGTAAAILGGAR